MSIDFIPSNDDQFNHFAVTLHGQVTASANPLKLPANVLAQWNAAFPAWGYAWNAWEAVAAQMQTLLQTKNDTRAALDAAVRAVNNSAQANELIPDPARAAAGLPVHKATRTAAGVPQTAPMMLAVDTPHLIQRLHWVDSATPGSKAKPAGVQVCEIRQLIQATGLPAPTDPTALPYLASDSRTPHRTDFDAGDVGQTAWYALRWVNTRQEPGPWSAVTGYQVV